MPTQDGEESEVIGIVYMRDRIIRMELDLNKWLRGPRGLSKMTFTPFDKACAVLMRQFPGLAERDPQVVGGDWVAG